VFFAIIIWERTQTASGNEQEDHLVQNSREDVAAVTVYGRRIPTSLGHIH